MTSHSLDPKQIQKMRTHSLQPSSWQFVGPLRSSFFERDARWNLLTRLIRDFLIRKHKKKKIITKKDRNDHVQNLERNGNSKNRIEKWVAFSTRSHVSIFQIIFPETDCHTRTRLPDQRETVTTCPALPTYPINSRTRSMLPILPSSIFKKNGKTGIPTHSFHDSHAWHPGAKKPTLGKASRDASDTRAWHTTCTL